MQYLSSCLCIYAVLKNALKKLFLFSYSLLSRSSCKWNIFLVLQNLEEHWHKMGWWRRSVTVGEEGRYPEFLSLHFALQFSAPVPSLVLFYKLVEFFLFRRFLSVSLPSNFLEVWPLIFLYCFWSSIYSKIHFFICQMSQSTFRPLSSAGFATGLKVLLQII